MTHELKYRAATQGLGAAGVPDGDALWFCSCRDWTMRARPMIHRDTGNNQIEADRSHKRHVLAADLVASDLADDYSDAEDKLRRFGVADD